MAELTLEQKVDILWRWQERMHRYAQLELTAREATRDYEQERRWLMYDLACPAAVGQEPFSPTLPEIEV